MQNKHDITAWFATFRVAIAGDILFLIQFHQSSLLPQILNPSFNGWSGIGDIMGTLKMQVQKMQVRNMRVQMAGTENASTENASTVDRHGKCKYGKCEYGLTSFWGKSVCKRFPEYSC